MSGVSSRSPCGLLHFAKLRLKCKCIRFRVRTVAVRSAVTALIRYIPVDVDGIAQQPQLAVGAHHFRAKPVATAIAHPGQRKTLIRRCYSCAGFDSDFLTVLQPSNRSACRGSYTQIEVHGLACGRGEKISRMDNLVSGSRSYFKKAIPGSRKINEHVSCTDAVKNRGRRKLGCVDDRRRASDGANFIERLHGPVVIASANPR